MVNVYRSVEDSGDGPRRPAPLFSDKSKARRAGKKMRPPRTPSYLRVSMNGLPFSEDLDPPLQIVSSLRKTT